MTVARARNLKPGLFKNELLGVADPLLTILFQSLWCLADRDGRMEDRPLRIKAETFPYREGVDINGYLTELARLGFICRYEVNGSRFIQVLNFTKHQNPHKTERPGTFPEMPMESDSCALTVNAPLNNGARPADSLVLTPDSLVPPTDTPAVAAKVRQAPRTDDDVEFIAAWNSYPKRPGASRADAFKAWSARVREGVKPDDMLAGVRRYADYVTKSGTEPQFIKQPATFLGPGEHYLADWTFNAARPNFAPASRHTGFAQIDYSEGIEDGRIA